MRAQRLADDRVGDDVTGSQLAALVVVVREALALAVEQHRALASDSLADEEALAVLRGGKGGGVELDAREVLDLRAEHIGKGDAVARGDRGVGRVLVDPADAARREDAVVAAEVAALAVPEHAQIEAAERFVHRVEQGVVEDLDVGQRLHIREQTVHDRLARGVLVMYNAVAAVTCLERLAQTAVGVAVEVNAERVDMEHVRGTLLHQLFDRLEGVFVLARDQRVGDMQLVVIVYRVEHARHAALCERAVGERQLLFGEQQHADVLGEAERGVKTCRACADNNHIVSFVHDVTFII